MKHRLLFLLLPLSGLLVEGHAAAQTFDLDCLYALADGEWKPHENCARRSDGKLRIAPAMLERLAFDDNGLGLVVLGRRWHYVKKTGEALEVVRFDNGADDFSEGLVRSPIDGKIAYYDAMFERVIAPIYDWGWPFENGRALVCQGCRPAPDPKGEHVPMVGGRWGYIDRSGNEVVPMTEERAPAPDPAP